jgi:nitroreductase
MDPKEAIYGRRAVREFTPKPVDEEVLRQLVDAAIQAPSAVNQQPWLFTVVQDKALLARISREAKPVKRRKGSRRSSFPARPCQSRPLS